MERKMKKMSTKTLTIGAALTALVIVLQTVSSFFLNFTFCSISLVLIPIIIGAALYGPKMGAWLGLVFAVTVLFVDKSVPTFFFNYSVIGTILTVVIKGVACGTASGLVYGLLKKKNKYVAAVLASVVCPVVNTGLFILGILTFLDAEGLKAVLTFMLLINFGVEFVLNIVLNPVIVRVLNFKELT